MIKIISKEGKKPFSIPNDISKEGQKQVKNSKNISTSDSSIPEYSVAQDSVGEPPVSTMVDEFTFKYNEIVLVLMMMVWPQR